ncbi:hypothetical protein PR048_030705 [Dryococelus australis]|uniref:Uncharacterized protein n=1 Tax=Dryococelus australis TaxID=614101 RepID=A0ABQ9G9N8_9NEOP|nr:hypothetical protein PR048_030705 [Dryococelus australis]
MLFHGRDITEACILHICQYTEESQEAKNMKNKQYRDRTPEFREKISAHAIFQYPAAVPAVFISLLAPCLFEKTFSYSAGQSESSKFNTARPRFVLGHLRSVTSNRESGPEPRVLCSATGREIFSRNYYDAKRRHRAKSPSLRILDIDMVRRMMNIPLQPRYGNSVWTAAYQRVAATGTSSSGVGSQLFFLSVDQPPLHLHGPPGLSTLNSLTSTCGGHLKGVVYADPGPKLQTLEERSNKGFAALRCSLYSDQPLPHMHTRGISRPAAVFTKLNNPIPSCSVNGLSQPARRIVHFTSFFVREYRWHACPYRSEGATCRTGNIMLENVGKINEDYGGGGGGRSRGNLVGTAPRRRGNFEFVTSGRKRRGGRMADGEKETRASKVLTLPWTDYNNEGTVLPSLVLRCDKDLCTARLGWKRDRETNHGHLLSSERYELGAPQLQAIHDKNEHLNEMARRFSSCKGTRPLIGRAKLWKTGFGSDWLLKFMKYSLFLACLPPHGSWSATEV